MPKYDDLMLPDFMANTQLPQWMSMGGDQSQAPDFSGVTSALKKRMGGSKPNPNGEMSYSDMLGGSIGKSGGGMSPESL